MILIFSFISALMFYIYPILIGRAIMKGLGKFIPVHYPFVTYFALGSLVLYISTIVGVFFFPTVPPKTLFTTLLMIFLIICLPLNLFLGYKDVIHTPKKYLFPLLFSLGLSIIVYFLWHVKSPYPFNWDMLEHQTLVNNMLAGKFSFFTTRISDTFTFGGYSSLFHTLLGYSQLFFSIDILVFWHTISIIHCTFVIFAGYLLAKEITGNTMIGILSSITNAFIFESTMIFMTLFFIPQTATGVLFIFLFLQLIVSMHKNSLPPFFIVILSIGVLFLSHYVMGIGAVGLYLATYLFIRFKPLIQSTISLKAFLVLFGILSAFAIGISSFIPLGFLNKGEAAAFTYTIFQKAAIVQQTYGYLLWAFIPVGIWAILKRKKAVEMIVLILTLGIFVVMLLQLPYILKFYVLGRFFVHFLIALGVYYLLSFIHSKPLYWMSLLVFGLTIASIYLINASFWKSFLIYNGEFTNISHNEIKAAHFLKTTYSGQDVLLVSDPATQHILEPLSGINTQGGAYTNEHTRNALSRLFEAKEPEVIASKIYEISDTLGTNEQKRLFAVSGRYYLWQLSSPENKQAISYNIWYPVDLTFEDRKRIQEFYPSPYFTLVYENPTIAIFEVTTN